MSTNLCDVGALFLQIFPHVAYQFLIPWFKLKLESAISTSQGALRNNGKSDLVKV